MKGKLFSVVVLVVILALVLVVPASAGKAKPLPYIEVTWDPAPTSSGTYTPSHSVALGAYRGYFLRYEISWYSPAGALTLMNTQAAIKTATDQTLVVPSSGFSFTVETCNPEDASYLATEKITVVDRKGTEIDGHTRSFYCQLNPANP